MTDALTIESIPVDHELIATPDHLPTAIDPLSGFLPVNWDDVERNAELISTCPGLATEFSDPKNCRFVAYQAQRWGTDPVMTAIKTYFTPRKGGGLVVGYEAQLIHALIEGDPHVLAPLDFRFGYADPAKKVAAMRFCEVSGIIHGSAKPKVVKSPTFSQIKIKNSPLWFSDLDQQFSYYTSRAWARRHRPSRILGIYAREEMETFRDVEALPKPSMWEEDGDADFGDAIPPEVTAEPEGPSGLEEARTWAAEQQAAILTTKDAKAATDAWNAMTAHELGRKLVAYEPAVMNAIKASVSKHVAGLKAT